MLPYMLFPDVVFQPVEIVLFPYMHLLCGTVSLKTLEIALASHLLSLLLRLICTLRHTSNFSFISIYGCNMSILVWEYNGHGMRVSIRVSTCTYVLTGFSRFLCSLTVHILYFYLIHVILNVLDAYRYVVFTDKCAIASYSYVYLQIQITEDTCSAPVTVFLMFYAHYKCMYVMYVCMLCAAHLSRWFCIMRNINVQ